MRSRALLAGALLAMAALLAACSTDPGPLSTGGPGAGPGSQCTPGALGHPVTMGVFLLYNAGTGPATVTSVTLPSPHGLGITKSWLMPAFNSHGILTYVGAGEPYPPIHWPTWPMREPIPGAVIKPGHSLSVVFGLTRTGTKDGHTGGSVITYTAGGNTYTLHEHFGFVVTAKKGC